MNARSVPTTTPDPRTAASRRNTAAAALAVSAALLMGCAASVPSVTDSAAPSANAEVAPEVAAAVNAVMKAGAVAVTIDIRDGDEVVSLAEGTADLVNGRAAAPEDRIRIASISKTVMAVVMLQLVDEGVLTLDTTVEEVLPGLLSTAPTAVTVRQLLSHTSGMPDYIEQLTPDVDAAIAGRDDVYSPEELVDVAQQAPWVSPPGTAFHYTNAGYTVLGLMAEEVTGQSVSELEESRIFEPVGMEATFDPTDASMPDDALRGYLSVNGEPVDLTEYEPSFWSFGASLISTVGDVSALNAAVQRGDLLQPETLEQMRAIGAEGYGLGLLIAGDACGANPPQIVYGQRGNGFGYNAVTLASADGERVVTVAYTGGAFDPASDPIFPAVNEALVAGLASTCP